jgi:hypothetical protein
MSTNVATAVTSNKKSAHCKKPSADQLALLTKAERREARRIEMQIRRAVQRQRQPGFTPVVNKRVSADVQGAFAELMVEHADKIASGTVTIPALQEQAVRRVAAKLPPERMVFDWRNQGRTKNDDAAYRKPFARQL